MRHHRSNELRLVDGGVPSEHRGGGGECASERVSRFNGVHRKRAAIGERGLQLVHLGLKRADAFVRGGESAFAGGAASGYPSAAFFGSEAVGVATDLDFYRAVLAVKRGDADEARLRTASARDALGSIAMLAVTTPRSGGRKKRHRTVRSMIAEMETASRRNATPHTG